MAKRDYDKDGRLIVHWDSDLCIHSAECIKAQPGVFRPRERPWIQVEAASAEQIAAAVDMCPSGALAYTWLEEADEPGAQTDGDAADSRVAGEAAAAVAAVRVTSDGPYEVHGPLEIMDEDGTPIARIGKTWLCRCGHSRNKPFCDGSHRRVGFSDPRPPAPQDPAGSQPGA